MTDRWLNQPVFTPIRAERLLIRPFGLDDAPGLAARRNDPEVARHLNYQLPYPPERAEKLVSDLVAMEGPKDDDWWMGEIRSYQPCCPGSRVEWRGRRR